LNLNKNALCIISTHKCTSCSKL